MQNEIMETLFDMLIKKAVEKNVVDELAELEAQADMCTHVFSENFNRRMNEIIENYEKYGL